MPMLNIPLSNPSNNYSNLLPSTLQPIYQSCIRNLSSGTLSTTVQLEPTEANQRAVESVVEAVIYGCPEIFFIEQQIETSWMGDRLTIRFTNKYADENIRDLWDKLNTEVDRIAAIINKFEKPYDKLNRLNQYPCARVKPVSSSQGRFGDAYGALILKEARCEGYAKAAKLIMDRCGLSGIIARGEAVSQERREPHAWIIAECDGNNYHFDFTWNAIKGLNGIPGVEYMFLDDETIGKEHFPSYAYPVCSDATKMFWVVNNGIIKYHSDLSRIKIVPVKNNYIAVAKIPQKLSKYEVDNEVINWMINDLAAYSYGSSINFSYNEPLDLLVFYFLN